MVKIVKTGSQYRINIPKEIIEQTGWNENTKLIITPYIKDPTDKITQETSMILRKIQSKSEDK